MILVIGIWGATLDVRRTRRAVLITEMESLRMRAQRTVRLIERETQRADTSITLDHSQWLNGLSVLPQIDEPRLLYTAVVDTNGQIVVHTDPSLTDQHLSERWYQRVMDDIGDNVVEVAPSDFSLSQRAYDVQVPIMLAGETIGNYHEGLSVQWFDEQFAQRRAELFWHWAIVIGSILLLVVAGGSMIYYLASGRLALQKKLNLIRLHRAAELGQIAGGLAHEIRNPLHALRLNFQALAKTYGSARLTSDEVDLILEQSNSEIDRVNRLLTELLGYACPEAGKLERFDLRNEVSATLEFVQPELKQNLINVCYQAPSTSVPVRMDRSRLRQILLNLLMNAQEACPDGGEVDLEIEVAKEEAVVRVRDCGAGISEEDAERIFEPFYSTHEKGSGLGLPLVQRFVQDAGGDVDYQPNQPQGAVFTVRLPLASKPALNGHT